MGLLTFALFVVIAFGLAARLLAGYMRRVADGAVTDQFRAAEAIAEGRTPARWVAEINRCLARRGAARSPQGDALGTRLALRRIDRLYRFFEHGLFYESAEARDLLLNRLLETRQRWERMAWHDIAAECEAPADVLDGDGWHDRQETDDQ
ncbi:MAG: hypothetical protein QME94_05610 [Anaerolineae bacterium]|nr:hypothetical protein [Anaerolineae bacterium]